MPFTEYELQRLLAYTLYILFGAYSIFIKKRSIDIYIFFYGVIYTAELLLDTYVFSSNIELGTTVALIMTGVYFHFINLQLKWPKLLAAIWLAQLVLLISAFSLKLDFGALNEAIIYDSKYGLLDTNETHKLLAVSALILQCFFLLAIYKVVRDQEWSVETRVYIIYAFILFLGQMDIFIFNVVTPLMFEDINLFFKVRAVVTPIFFGLVHIGLLLNLVWKR